MNDCGGEVNNDDDDVNEEETSKDDDEVEVGLHILMGKAEDVADEEEKNDNGITLLNAFVNVDIFLTTFEDSISLILFPVLLDVLVGAEMFLTTFDSLSLIVLMMLVSAEQLLLIIPWLSLLLTQLFNLQLLAVQSLYA